MAKYHAINKYRINSIQKAQLRPDSDVVEKWAHPKVEMTIEFYFFNVTNPNEVMNGSEKPRVVEIGPYAFR